MSLWPGEKANKYPLFGNQFYLINFANEKLALEGAKREKC